MSILLDQPPKGWRRPQLTLRARHDAMRRKLEELLGGPIEFDHRPGLWERCYHIKSNDTVPPANDPNFIEVISKAEHKVRTSGTKATSAGSDTHRRAKEKRLRVRYGPPRPQSVLDLVQILKDEGEKREERREKWRSKWGGSRPLPGSKASGMRKRMSGKVEKR